MICNFSWSAELSHNYYFEQVDFFDLYQLTWSDFNYSAGRFRNGHRSVEDWEGGNNCVVLDIDTGLAIEEAKKILQGRDMLGLIVTTKSHQKDKHGFICDRFRIIFPMRTQLHCPTETYKVIFNEINKLFNYSVDAATKDPSRFYYGNANQLHWYIEGGTIFDWRMFIPVQKPTIKTYTPQNTIKGDSKALVEWGIKNIREGNRNMALYWVYEECKRSGYDPVIVVNSINSALQRPLETEELRNILRQKAL
jgi:hypothetical protein